MDYYCFVKEDFNDLKDEDPLVIQAEYAKKINKYCYCSIEEKDVFDIRGEKLSTIGKEVFLRTTYDNLEEAIILLNRNGAILKEKKTDILDIENWDRLSLTKRKIYRIEAREIVDFSICDRLKSELTSMNAVFLKTRIKDFSIKIATKRLFDKDKDIKQFFIDKNIDLDEQLLMSELYDIKSDSLGLKESRFFVLDGSIINSSRNLHSIKHSVPKSHISEAEHIVNSIFNDNRFPKSYVLDIADFQINGHCFIDIVEFNPLSCSLCYLNNSIFNAEISNINFDNNKSGMGIEYFYDSIKNPNRYFKNRYSNVLYTYSNDDRYELL